MIKALNHKHNVQFAITLIATLTLLIILWATWQVIIQPDIGVLWKEQGEIYVVSHDSLLKVDDKILSIDGAALTESAFPYFTGNQKDNVTLRVARNNEEFIITVPFSQRAPLTILLARLSVIVVVLAFWGISTHVALFSSSSFQQSLIFFFFCQTLGIALALGSITSKDWAAHSSLMLTAFAIAMAIHFHMLFPIDRVTKSTRKWVFLIYAIASLGVSRLLIQFGLFDVQSPFATTYASLLDIWALIGLVMVLYLLFKPYRDNPTPIVKRQINLVALCGALALTPLLALSILPQILFDQEILPTEVAFLFLIFIPLGYGYAITKYQLIKLERYTSRSATAVFLISLLSFFYISISTFLNTLPSEHFLANPLTNVAIIMCLVVIYHPLHKKLRQLVDYLLYGGWYDYTSVVGEITHNLEHNTDIETLVSTLTGTIQKSMRVYWACLIWQGRKQDHSVISAASQTETLFNDINLKNLPVITEYMQTQLYPIANDELCQILKDGELTSEENQLLNNLSVRLWVPIRGFQYSMGLLILGPKLGGDGFDDDDMEILDMVSRQASVVFQNAQLVNELKVKVSENEQYQKEIIRTREEERKRIARELHDQVIQTLVGLKYQIAHLQSSLNLAQVYPESNQKALGLQDEMLALIQTTRSLCQDLRPAALDLGLIPSIRSLAGSFEMKSGIEVDLRVEGDREVQIDEDTALCLYRCTGEALSNIGKHAVAEEVIIDVNLCPNYVSLTIQDDGKGFHVPERLGSLMTKNHFGLVGMRERVELLQGSFNVFSDPLLGTQLEVYIPLKNGHS